MNREIFAFPSGITARATGCGETVVWLHGYTMDSTVWEPLWALLPGWRHVGIDLPGHGQSRALTPDDTLPNIAQQVDAACRVLGARHLVAMSFGSLVAIEVAIRAGKQLDSLVLAAPTLGGMAPDPVAQERNMQLRRVFEQEGAGTHMTKLWMRSPPDIFRGIESKPTLWANLCEIINRHSWCELGHKAMGVIADHPHRGSVLASIHAHTMVLVGEEDMPTFKRNAHTILCAIPLCSRAYIEGCGHLPLIEDPNASAKLLSAHFLVTSQASTSSADGE